jgi:hypothetical protein
MRGNRREKLALKVGPVRLEAEGSGTVSQISRAVQVLLVALALCMVIIAVGPSPLTNGIKSLAMLFGEWLRLS